MNILRAVISSGNRDLVFVNANLLGFAAFGVLVTCSVWWDRCSVALLWAAAAAATGFIVGFIFGFPRTIAQPLLPNTSATNPAAPVARASADAAQSARTSRLYVNTNLEQVSDWITKTIVAIGLVQLRELPRRFGQLAAYAGMALGKPYTGASANETAAALIGYFLVLGFLAGYLLTRMFFQAAFSRGDEVLERAADLLKNASFGSIGAPQARTSPISEQVTAAAEKLKNLSPSTATTFGISTAAIARANLLSGDPKQAVEAYRTAITGDPWNPRLRFEYASALENADAPSTEVLAALRDARAVESQKPDPDLRRRIYESLTYVALYEPEPQGFTDAIFYGTAYTSEPTNLPSAVVWVNLAAAYGQQARWRKAHEGSLNKEVRDRAFASARQAIRLDPDEKAFLASLMRGDVPGEDDLSVFKEDEEFRELLGVSELKQ